MPDCKCAKEKMGNWIEAIYPYIDVPVFYHDICRPVETRSCQLKHNYCPRCGTKYKEVSE